VAEPRQALERVIDGAARAAALASYREARARALDARHTLIIQREAIGLRNHRIVDQQFPEPLAFVQPSKNFLDGAELTRQGGSTPAATP